MATTGTNKQAKQNNQGQSKSTQQKQGEGFPLDNLSYDLVTLLYEKSKALEAFDKYIQDAQNDEQALQLFEQMRQADEQFIGQLRDQVGQRFVQA
jgi:hypothetical protein